MNNNYDFKIDTHMHTIASGHAFNTYNEMIDAAIKKDMDLICITEHGPKMPGSCHPYYHTNMRIIKKDTYNKKYGNIIRANEYMKVIKGFEANIIDFDGNTDYDDLGDNIGDLKYIIASFHSVCLESGTVEQNTNAYIGAIRKPYTMTVGHIDDGRIPCDFEKVVMAAKENNVLVELNNSSLLPTTFRVNSVNNALEYISLCKEKEIQIVLGSDAHLDSDIGNFECAIEVLKKVDFPRELIINSDKEKFLKWLNEKYEKRMR